MKPNAYIYIYVFQLDQSKDQALHYLEGVSHSHPFF